MISDPIELRAGDVYRYHHTSALVRLILQLPEHPDLWVVEWLTGGRPMPFAVLRGTWLTAAPDWSDRGTRQPLPDAEAEAWWTQRAERIVAEHQGSTVTPPAHDDPLPPTASAEGDPDA